jgi:hypothetical protein
MTISLSGLDLSFLRKPKGFRPKTGRFRTDPKTGESVTIQEWYRRNPVQSKRGDVVCPLYIPDVDAAYGGAWQSIIDGSEISSRSNWREHNKKNDVVDVGDKFFSPDGDDVKRTEEIMGYDKSLIGHPDFVWGKQDLD